MKNPLIVQDKRLIEEILDKTQYGVLALNGERPYALPVNFVYFESAIYFHGSHKGKKMTILKKKPLVSFSVIADHTILPSYIMSDSDLACPATAFFKSIIIDGKVESIINMKEKRVVFSAMMKKLQKEGKYLDFDSNEYDRALKKVALLKINIESISAKFKFGQNYSESKRALIISNLEKRNDPNDKLIVADIKALYKLSKNKKYKKI